MYNYEEMKKEITKIIKQGKKLYEAVLRESDENNECNDLIYFLTNYEIWYTEALKVVKQISPDRTNDFILLYNNPKRKDLTILTYTISDALRTISSRVGNYSPSTAALCVYRQVNMIQACLNSFDSKISNIQTILQADIFDSEIDSARHLHKKGFLRAAGAICGVIIEKHFAGVANNHNITIKKKSPTIADFNDAFKDDVYDTLEWRRIQRLGDIRNLCDHNKDREPTKEEVDELINGTDRIIKTIF